MFKKITLVKGRRYQEEILIYNKKGLRALKLCEKYKKL